MNWRDQAACKPSKHVNPQWFDDRLDTPETDEQRAERHEKARRICNAWCPVRDQCDLEALLSRNAPEGIRAGVLYESET